MDRMQSIARKLGRLQDEIRQAERTGRDEVEAELRAEAKTLVAEYKTLDQR
jgi:hypothetical protein